MPDSRDVRSGKDLKLKAVFLPQDLGGMASTHNTAISLGPNTLRLPAVFVPEGSSPPGYPYVNFGKMTFDQDDHDSAGPTTSPGSKAAGPTGESQQGIPPSPPGMADRPDTHPVAASTADRGSRNTGNIGRQSSAPLGQELHDQLTRLGDGVGRAASLASGFVDPARGTSASQYGIAGSASQSAVGGDDQALRSPDPSRDAIEAALRAQTVMPTDGMPLQSIDWTTLTKWPQSALSETPQLGELTEKSSGHSERDPDNDATHTRPILGSTSFGQGG